MKHLLVLFLVLFGITPIYAQDESETLSPVVVEGTPLRIPLDYPSAFSTTIELDEYFGEFKTSSELLSLSPGVFVRDFGGYGQLQTISIRGSSNDQVSVLLDGVKLNNPIGGGIDLSTIPTAYVERFEIIRGGASALAGTDAIGGVVNIVTKPTSVPLTVATATYGSFQTFAANFTRSQQIGDLGYLVSASHAQSKGDFKFKTINGLTRTRINNKFRADSLLAKADYQLESGWEIRFLNEFFYDSRGVPGLGEFQQRNAHQKDIRNLTSVVFSKPEFLSRDVDLNIILYNRFDWLKFTNPTPTVGVPIDTRSNTYSAGLNPRLRWFAPYNQIITVATEVKTEFLKNADFDNPKRFTYSLFASDEIGFYEGKLIINPLIRYDVWTTWGEQSDTEGGFSPKLGVLFSPLEFLIIKGNLGRSFRVPSFGELFFPEQGFIGGNPDLKPETSYDFDVGILLSHPRAKFEIIYFRNKIKNLIQFVFINAFRIEPRNLSDVTEQGFETSLALRPLDNLYLYAAYTFLDGEVKDTGAQLPGRPKNNFDFRGVLDLNLFTIFWETHYVDKIPLNTFPNGRTTDARTTHDIGGKAAWNNIFVTIEIKNLFNNLNVRDALDFPLPGRTVFATAGLNFK